ncbi:DNA cytosine methyltransferase [Hymenobacter perfusus]|uniref:Cytosine-specific methyltransferase n=1 Tax=Hymenobacter perfusus TaxID=1236770 RepID=A0A428JXX7_9BACT|nr:DNA (cytosine-5-)-methyltransferase [Hymenobacter perfusus]RSK38982.1 DNA (cytosine-5-)-methyltransferase [Hymenobacter perfusus]
MNYIDLFAGAGGLSEGFHNAGFTPVAHVEMDAYACDTIRTRLAWYYLKNQKNHQPYFDYLRKRLPREELYKLIPSEVLDSVINGTIGEDTREAIFDRIDRLLQRLPEGQREIDLIVGGPPCQTFSVAGRARLGSAAMEKDPRSKLYVQYAKFLSKYRPRMFVFENVLGMLSFKNGQQLNLIRETFLDAGYVMDVREWNARDFGVLQSRERLIIIGWRIDQPALGYPVFKTLTPEEQNEHLVAELLDDLPSLEPGQRLPNATAYTQQQTPYIRKTGLRRDCPVITWHETRPHREADREIYRLFIEHWNDGGDQYQRMRYDELPANLMFHENKKDFTDRFKVVARDMTYSQTVVAHISKDGHYYIHPDIAQRRSLSVREAARLQSFPDNFYFEGPRTSVLKQIGNAVPPLMGTRIAESVRDALGGCAAFLSPDSPVGKRRSGKVEKQLAKASEQLVLSYAG